MFPADIKILLGKRMMHFGSSKKTVLMYFCMLYILHAGDTETISGPEFLSNISVIKNVAGAVMLFNATLMI